MIGVLLLGTSLFSSSIISAPILPNLLRPFYALIPHSTHSNIRVQPVKSHHHQQDTHEPPPHDVYAHAPVLETYEPVAPETETHAAPSYAPSTVKYEPHPYVPSSYEPAPPQPSEEQEFEQSFENFDVSLTNEESDILNQEPDTPIVTEPPVPSTTIRAVTKGIIPEVSTTAAPPPPTTSLTTVTAASVSEVIDLRDTVVLDDESSESDITDIPIEIVLEMAKDPKADKLILEMAVDKIKEVQELNDNLANENDGEVGFNTPTSFVNAMPTEILLEMAKDPDAGDNILKVAVERLKEELQEESGQSDEEDVKDATPDIDIPLEIILEMAKDPKAKEPVLEMAVDKIEEAIEIKENFADTNPRLNVIKDDLAEAMPMEILLEMAKDPKASEPILKIAMERLKQIQESSVESDVDNSDNEKHIDTSKIPLEIILEVAKDPKAEEPILEMAVEKIQEVLDIKHDKPESDHAINAVENKLAKAIPIEILLEMAKDPEASEPILEIAMDRLKEIKEDNAESDKEDNQVENKPDTSNIPLEIILDMAKDPEAEKPILEFAMEKIKEVLEQKEDEFQSQHVSNDSPDIIPNTLPMQIVLEMAKDPEAKEHILEMAMDRLKELQDLNIESDLELVALEPKPVEGENAVDIKKKSENPPVVQFPRLF